MKTEIKLVTPEIAKELLSRNTLNRQVSQDRVLFYSDQMKRGLWALTGQGISIDQNRNIIDGQHRLSAVVHSGISIELLIISELVFDDVFDKYDTGKSRSGGDVLYIDGVAEARDKSAIINYYFTLLSNYNIGLTTTSKLRIGRSLHIKKSNSDILSAYHENNILVDEINTQSARCYKKVKLLSKSAVGGIEMYLVKEKKHAIDKVFSFFDQLFSGKNIENMSIENLRNKLLSEFGNTVKMNSHYKMALLIKTWNAYVKGIEIKKIYYNSENEPYPVFL